MIIGKDLDLNAAVLAIKNLVVFMITDWRIWASVAFILLLWRGPALLRGWRGRG